MNIYNNTNEEFTFNNDRYKYNLAITVKEVMNDLSNNGKPIPAINIIDWYKNVLPIELLSLLGTINKYNELEGLVRIKGSDINTLEIIVNHNCGIDSECITYYYSTITPIQFDNIKKIVDDAVISLTKDRIISKVNKSLNSLEPDELKVLMDVDIAELFNDLICKVI